MFPGDVARAGAVTDLSVDLGISVALVGLGPVYAHGLRAVLAGTGLQCTVVPSAQELAPLLTAGATVVAVAPAGVAATLDGSVGAASRFATVHVLDESTPQAYSTALREGATSAFGVDAEPSEIMRVVLCAGLGMTLLPLAVARALNSTSTGPRRELTEQDRTYLRMLADGATVAGLARRFAHSEREMYRLLSATYQRLGARNRTEALLLAQRSGVFDQGA